MKNPGAYDSIPEEFSRRRDGAPGDELQPSRTPESQAEVVVLHHVDFPESSESLEDVSPHVDCLVSIELVEEPGAQVSPEVSDPQEPVSRVKDGLEAPSDGAAENGAADGYPCVVRESCVGMQEEENVPLRRPGSCVHLVRPATRRQEHPRPQPRCRLARSVLGAAIDDDGFVEGSEPDAEAGRLIEDGDDGRDLHTFISGR